MTRLTAEQVSRASGGAGTEATSLDLSVRALTDVSYLGIFKNLERLELKSNCLTSLESLSSCVNLKWLSVVENKLGSLKGIEGLSKLTVLNAGKNKLKSMDEIKCVRSLCALILNDNNISTICKLDELQQLNTLVLSHNPISDIGDALCKLKSLSKLSLSYCQIQKIGTSLATCLELKELRLSHNNIADISPELAKNNKIAILDLGNNLIERHSDLKVLSALHRLRNLNLLGNPVVGKDGFAAKLKNYNPSLRILNSKPIEMSSISGNMSQKDKKVGSATNDRSENSRIEVLEKMKRKRSASDMEHSSEEAVADSKAKDLRGVTASNKHSAKAEKGKKKRDDSSGNTEDKEVKRKRSKSDMKHSSETAVADSKAKELQGIIASNKNSAKVEKGKNERDDSSGNADTEDKEVKRKRSKSDTKYSPEMAIANAKAEDLPGIMTRSKPSAKVKKGKNERNASVKSNADAEVKKDVKKKKSISNEEPKARKGLDDTQASFLDLILAEKEGVEEPELQNKDDAKGVPVAKFPGVVVINHAKKGSKNQQTVPSGTKTLPRNLSGLRGMAEPLPWD